MSITAKSVIIDVENNWGSADFLQFRSIEFYLNGTLVDVGTGVKGYSTTNWDVVDMTAREVFETPCFKTGIASEFEYRSLKFSVTNQRIIGVFTYNKTFDKIVINNSHSYGEDTDRGIKDCTITVSTDEITSTVYGETVTNGTLIFDGQFPIHSSEDSAQDFELTLSNIPETVNLIGAKSVILDFADNWGDSGRMLFRCIEFFQNDIVVDLFSTPKAMASATNYGSPTNCFKTPPTKAGAYDDYGWGSNTLTNVRMIGILTTGSYERFNRIVVNNGHSSGSYVSRGVKNLKITISDDYYTDTTYGAVVPNSTLVFDGQIAMHSSVNEADDQELLLINMPDVSVEEPTTNEVSNMYMVSGNVAEGVTPVVRKVRIFSRETGFLLGETLSDSNGDFKISYLPNTAEVNVLIYDNESGDVYNDLSYRIVPIMDPEFPKWPSIVTGNIKQKFSSTVMEGVWFNTEGTRAYILRYSNIEKIYQYDLSIPWDLSTAVYNSVYFDTLPFLQVHGFVISFDGSKLYMSDTSSKKIYVADMSTPWDLSTAVYDSSQDYSAGLTEAHCIRWKPDGMICYISAYGTLYQYNCVTPWHLSGSTRSNGIYFGANNYYTFDFKPDGSKLYVINTYINTYELGILWDVRREVTNMNEKLYSSSSLISQGCYFRTDGMMCWYVDINQILEITLRPEILY